MITSKATSHAVFVDWITASQHHPAGGLPVICSGLTVVYDAAGVARFEQARAATFEGSYSTGVRVQCDGFRVFLSGNVGRFSRQDNLFNHGWEGTKACCNRILLECGLPPFGPSSGRPLQGGTEYGPDDWKAGRYRGAVVSRLDLTGNYSTGSEAQARAVIRWLASRSVQRVKRGVAGDESVWWANTRHMFKAYIKHLEMLKHGTDHSEMAYQWAKAEGLVRVEVEMKKRLLSDLSLNDWGDITQERLEAAYDDQTDVLRSVDRSDEPDILDEIPVRSRAFAAAWLAGQDIRQLCSQATMYRHAKVLREHGIDIMTPRNVETFPVKVRTVELRPLTAPDWYDLAPTATLRAVA